MIVSNPTIISIKQIADIVNEELEPKGYKICTDIDPTSFDFETRSITTDTSRMRNVLGIEPINLKKTIIDSVYSYIEHGLFVPESNIKKEKSFSFMFFNKQ